MGTGRVDVKMDVHDVMLSIEYAIPCGLILNELITNSLKYAFPEGQNGEIQVTLRPEADGRFRLRVKDDGVGLPLGLDIENSDSLGLQLVTTLTGQLGGKLEIDSGRGACFAILFPGR